MDKSLPSLTCKLEVQTTASSNGTKSYQICIEQQDKKYGLFRAFTELAKDEHLPPKSIASSDDVKARLKIILKGSFLRTPGTGLELFRKCTEHFSGHVKPVFIQPAIAAINKEAGAPEIIIGKNEMRRFVYSIK